MIEEKKEGFSRAELVKELRRFMKQNSPQFKRFREVRRFSRMIYEKERYLPFYTMSKSRIFWKVIRVDHGFFYSLTLWPSIMKIKMTSDKRLNCINLILDKEDGLNG